SAAWAIDDFMTEILLQGAGKSLLAGFPPLCRVLWPGAGKRAIVAEFPLSGRPPSPNESSAALLSTQCLCLVAATDLRLCRLTSLWTVPRGRAGGWTGGRPANGLSRHAAGDPRAAVCLSADGTCRHRRCGLWAGLPGCTDVSAGPSGARHQQQC